MAWADALLSLGFEPPLRLLNGAATRTAILDAMGELIRTSSAGDVLVIQFAGHGTQVRDLDGDEALGDTPGLDEALCPIDFPDGAFVIDDDIAELCERIAEGVNVTFFVDCCHSGTVTRLGVGVDASGHLLDERPRFIAATPEMNAAHERYRAQLPARRTASGRLPLRREVLFSACRSDEVAWESNGHGDFTTKATSLLRGGVAGLSHSAFQGLVQQAFGPSARQHPELHCDPAAEGRLLLCPIGELTDTRPPSPGQGASSPPPGLIAALESLLQQYRPQRGKP